MNEMCPKSMEEVYGSGMATPLSLMSVCPFRSPLSEEEYIFKAAILTTSTPKKPQQYKKKSKKAKKDSPSIPNRKTPSPVGNPNRKFPNRRRRRQSSSSSSVTGCSFSSNDSAYGTETSSSGTESPSKGGSPHRMSPVECQTPPPRTGISSLDFAPVGLDLFYGLIDDDKLHAGCKYHTLPDPENLPKPPTEWLKDEIIKEDTAVEEDIVVKEDIVLKEDTSINDTKCESGYGSVTEDINVTSNFEIAQQLKLMLKLSH